nr:LamG domain-containing protein [Candidatus Cloacimonadota bacterium]
PWDSSLQLNGNGQYVMCGEKSDFYFTNQLTVEAWIYPTDFKSAEHMNTIVSKTYWDPTSYGWTLRYGSSNGTLCFNMAGEGTSWINCMADNALIQNTWQHVAATYNGSVIALYVNGVQVATQSHSGDIINATINNLCIGSTHYADYRYMTGLIDEVRIWDIARSENEISASLDHCDITDNLLAYYRMTDGTGSSLTDNSGHGYTGELVGGPSWNFTNLFDANPIVKTEDVTPSGLYDATAEGHIYYLGHYDIIQHGHCWSIDPDRSFPIYPKSLLYSLRIPIPLIQVPRFNMI